MNEHVIQYWIAMTMKCFQVACRSPDVACIYRGLMDTYSDAANHERRRQQSFGVDA